jgi:hypothetical protein
VDSKNSTDSMENMDSLFERKSPDNENLLATNLGDRARFSQLSFLFKGFLLKVICNVIHSNHFIIQLYNPNDSLICSIILTNIRVNSFTYQSFYSTCVISFTVL